MTDLKNANINTVPYFDKDTTSIIKGIALVLMFIHHFFTFPNWWVEGINYPFFERISPYICYPLKICVPVFCFLTGYFYFFNNKKTYKYTFRKITDFLINYWGVFFIFSIIAVLSVHYVYTPVGFIKEMFALTRPTMSFCWYVSFYILAMILLPLFIKLLSKNIFFDIFISFIMFPLFMGIIKYAFINYMDNAVVIELIDNLQWIQTVLAGYIFARYKLFEKMSYYFSKIIRNKGIAVALSLAAVFCIPMGRYFLLYISIDLGTIPMINKAIKFSISTDIFYAPLFIFFIIKITEIVKLKYTRIILKQIGKYSLLMWFASCIFFNNSKSVIQPVLYLPRNPLLVLIWGLLMCYVFAYLLDKGLSFIIKQKNKYIFKQ